MPALGRYPLFQGFGEVVSTQLGSFSGERTIAWADLCPPTTGQTIHSYSPGGSDPAGPRAPFRTAMTMLVWRVRVWNTRLDPLSRSMSYAVAPAAGAQASLSCVVAPGDEGGFGGGLAFVFGLALVFGDVCVAPGVVVACVVRAGAWPFVGRAGVDCVGAAAVVTWARGVDDAGRPMWPVIDGSTTRAVSGVDLR